jgi:hypothetical protein
MLRKGPLSPDEAAFRGRIGAYRLHTTHDPRETTAKARETFLSRFEREVDPDGELPKAERQRRAEATRRAYFARLAYQSGKPAAPVPLLGRERRHEGQANPTAGTAGARPGAIHAARASVVPQSRSRYSVDLRSLFDFELEDVGARYQWLAQQPDLDFPTETRELIQVWLDNIVAEWRRRERYGLKSPRPNYGIPEDLKEQLKRDADIVAIIGDDVDLRRMDRDSRGTCPLCRSDNPTTLAVTPGPPALWHCFKRDEGGDVYRWVMLYHCIDFSEAVRWLASRLGQPLPEHEQRRRSRRTLPSIPPSEVRRAG